ncbi:hypothetical protein GQ600_22823 [Phytophthora cactorum]|nr:hypothetical protein GQ600_22823 [Phytophthora cactorum]
MWANYGRRRCFSSGSTITNRVEAAWNQLKQLLGKTTSIDRCIRRFCDDGEPVRYLPTCDGPATGCLAPHQYCSESIHNEDGAAAMGELQI